MILAHTLWILGWLLFSYMAVKIYYSSPSVIDICISGLISGGCIGYFLAMYLL